MIANQVYNNFASGELSPSVWGRSDRPFYNTGLEFCRNYIPLLTGGLLFRPGFSYVIHTRLNQPAFLISFRFNSTQNYTLEFTALKMRVHTQGGVVLETALNVGGITQASPGVVTVTAHGFLTGDEVYFASVGGMTEVNGQFYLVVKVDANTFTLTDVDGNAIDTTAFGAFTSGGTVARIYEVTTPYVEDDLWQIKIAQNADLMYIVHPAHAPRKLIRYGHANWTMSTYTRTNDPFVGVAKNISAITKANPGVVTVTGHGYVTGDTLDFASVGGMTELNGNEYRITRIDDNTFSLRTLTGVVVDTTSYTTYTSGGTTTQTGLYPAAVGFYGGRLWMGGSDGDPDVLHGSRGPHSSTGQSQYDDFTTGSSANDAIVFTISPQGPTADKLTWFGGTPAFMVVGTTGGVYKANGGADGAAITPTAIAVTPVSSFAVADIAPVFIGNQLVYVDSDARTLRSFEYDLLGDGYYAFDKNLLAEEITNPELTQIGVSLGHPDLIWGVRSDGVLLTCTFLSKEDVAGWARHKIGGDGKVLSLAVEPQQGATNQIVVCVERTINGATRRYIEYSTEDPLIPDIDDEFTSVDAEAADEQRYRNKIFELQKKFVRVDSAVILDTTQTATLTLSSVTGDSVTATANASIFEAGDVGRFIFIKYVTGDETGVAQITGFTSATEVTINILQDFSGTSIASGGWYFLVSTVQGLGHLEGETVGVLTDGAVHPDAEVEDGEITLQYPARYVIVGEKYLGFLRFLDLEMATQAGSIQGVKKNISGLSLRLRNTMGGKVGSKSRRLYDMYEMDFRVSDRDLTDRPPLLFSGIKALAHFDDWSESKKLCIVQDQPLPMTVLALILQIETAE